ncbi:MULTISPECIES: hypothetical protein [unclassified Devosia]|uniref:hypothetical protein n=1 Tax=unclassified Devosia TaxID=196773 RepID=UPI00145F8A2C|nr:MULTISPECIES: hypothetical protein [unclassified Devosia]MBJ6987910.1 hypothetical protein [Devosia sp. MC521]QMW63810.1 hypothetical protein H4N61_05675 [Devosia sp. MC521]
MNASADPILQPLVQGRSRLKLRLFAAACIGATSAMSIVLAVDTGLRLLGQQGLSPLNQFMSAAAFAGIGLGVVLSSDWRRLANPQHLALAIDRKSDMRLGYATALEAYSRDESSSVAKALIDNARAASSGLDQAKLWPYFTKTVQVFLAVNLLVGGLALALQNTVLTPSLQPVVETSERSADDIRDSAQSLADQLKREAIGRNEPILEALARAIEERVANASEETSSEELEAELDALIDQAKSAFGDTPPSWLNNNRITGKPQDGTAGATITGGPRNAPEQAGDDTFAINLDDLESARRQRQLNIMEANGEQLDETEAFGEITEGDNKPMSGAMSMQKLEPKQLQIAAREAVGASADSGKGPADQAGGGSSDLLGESFALGANGAEDFSLPQSTQETGRRIRISLPPSESEQGLAGAGSGEAGATVSAHAPVPVTRSTISASHRSTLSRYFEKVSE